MVLRFFLFASAILFMSCGDIQRDHPDDPGGTNYQGRHLDSSSSVVSSSSVASSSSGVVTYAVTYDVNGGIGAPMEQTKTQDATLTLSTTVPTRTGYIFAGWNTAANGSGISYVAGASYVANTAVTLYAQWNVNCNLNGRTVTVGAQVWMAENLNCDVSGSKCYDNDEANCAKYGRLYDWATAMNLPDSCDSFTCASLINTKHQGICPSGWHIPSNADLDKLLRYLTDYASDTTYWYGFPAGRHLKATIGWDNDGNGQDTYGFAALPGGYGGWNSGIYFANVGKEGYWWSASASCLNMYSGGERASYWEYYTNGFYSVRCLQDKLVEESSITYTVTYNANDGTGAPMAQTKKHNIALTLSTVIPTRTGYTFTGWNTDVESDGMSYASGASYTANANVTLYAQWVVSHNCSLNGRTVNIGGQVWMAENLNCDVNGSKCGDNLESNCDIYGRLYDWTTAMALPLSCKYSHNTCASLINTKHQGICPSGWHIPSDDEWNALITTVGGSSIAGKKLKATSGWANRGDGSSGNGTDDYGFSALPIGSEDACAGIWWSATAANRLDIYCGFDDVKYVPSGKDGLFSIRCLKD